MLSGSASACSREAMFTPSPNTSPLAGRYRQNGCQCGRESVRLGLCRCYARELRLNTLGALHGVHHGGEIDQKGIPDGLDDRTMMFRYRVANNLVMEVQQAQRPGFVRAHLTAKAHDVRKHDCGESSLLRVRRAVGVVLHRYRLFCWRCQAVNRHYIISFPGRAWERGESQEKHQRRTVPCPRGNT